MPHSDFINVTYSCSKFNPRNFTCFQTGNHCTKREYISRGGRPMCPCGETDITDCDGLSRNNLECFFARFENVITTTHCPISDDGRCLLVKNVSRETQKGERMACRLGNLNPKDFTCRLDKCPCEKEDCSNYYDLDKSEDHMLRSESQHTSNPPEADVQAGDGI